LKLAALQDEVRDLDLARFKAAHPEPALLFPANFASAVALGESRVDTPTQGLRLRDEQTTTSFAVRDGKKRSQPKLEKATPIVLFLTKSARNPFGNMITIGRAANNDVCLPLSSVSKLHAYFTQLPSGWALCDGNATNGTFVAEKRLAPGTSAPLACGAVVGFGPETIATFYLPDGLFTFLRASPRTH
jgi:hypothetical protein